MTDPKAVHLLEVSRDREPVGTLARTREGSVFRYHDDYLTCDQPAIALHLPKRAEGIEARGVTNLPSFFAGLLPEGVMQDAIVHTNRLSRDDLFSQLAVTGYDAIGDVTVRVPGHEPPAGPIKPGEVKALIDALLQGRPGPTSGAVSGAQPKLSIGHAVASTRGTVAIVKIEPDRFPGLLANEVYFMTLARKAGLRAARLKMVGDVLVEQRFDRMKRDGQPPAQTHVEDALQAMDLYPLAKYSLDYLEILDAATRLGVGRAVHLDLLRLYAYSYAIGNGDLHAKNVSFELRNESWQMTPAYDLVCTLPYFESDAFGRHMALPLDEQYGEFTAADFQRAGARHNLPERAIDSMLRRVGKGVLEGLMETPPPVPSSAADEMRKRAGRFAGA